MRVALCAEGVRNRFTTLPMVESVTHFWIYLALSLTSLFPGDYVVKTPMVLGHESAGIVFQGRL